MTKVPYSAPEICMIVSERDGSDNFIEGNRKDEMS